MRAGSQPARAQRLDHTLACTWLGLVDVLDADIGISEAVAKHVNSAVLHERPSLLVV